MLQLVSVSSMSLPILLPQYKPPTTGSTDKHASREKAKLLEGLTISFFTALHKYDRNATVFRMNTSRRFKYQPNEQPPSMGLEDLFVRAMNFEDTRPHAKFTVKEITTIKLDEEGGQAEVLLMTECFGMEDDIKIMSLALMSWVKQGWIWKASKFRAIRMPIPGI